MSNLTEFFRNSKVRIISDLEGEGIPDVNNEKILICGDILDSTISRGVDTSKMPISGTIGKFNKTYNIRNLLNVVNNANIRLILGNRDLNKLKCNPLCKMKTPSKDKSLYVDFNEGRINLSKDTYKIYKNLLKNAGWISNMKSWAPFWNNSIWNKTLKNKDGTDTDNPNYKLWCNDNNTDKDDAFPFFERFNRIFGADGSDGTMSAGNLLYAIPIEIFGQQKYTQIYKNDDETKDYFAFIVLATFNAMFNTTQTINTKFKIINEKEILSTTYLGGLLNKFYNSIHVLFIGYYDINDNFYIFSHGGITADLLTNVTNGAKTFIDTLKDIIRVNKSKITYPNDRCLQKGGNIPVNTSFESTVLIEKINTIEQELKKILKSSLALIHNQSIDTRTNNSEFLPSNNTLLLFALSALYKPTGEENRFINYSPINPGVITIKNSMFTCSNKKLYQIIGHVPKGYGPSLISFKDNNDNKSYLINIDISQSYKYGGKAGKSNVYFIYDNDMKLNYYLDLNEMQEEIYYLDTITEVPVIILDENKYDKKIKNFTVLESLSDIFDKETELISLLKSKKIKLNNKDKNAIFYHGYSKQDKHLFHIFTLFDDDNSHDKVLLIIKDNKQTSMQGGYYQKYLKYKQKYLKLKQLQL